MEVVIMEDNEFMTSKDVCRYCGFSLNLLRRLEREGKLKPVRILPGSKRKLYKLEDVETYLDTIRTSSNSNNTDDEE
jgi:DNA-binding transcriptional MerR regulator